MNNKMFIGEYEHRIRESMNIIEKINFLTEQYKKQKEQFKSQKESADTFPELVTLKKSADSSSLPTYKAYLIHHNIPIKFIDTAVFHYLNDSPLISLPKEESWYIVTTREGKRALWIKYIQHETRIQMEKLYNSPTILRHNPLGHNRIVTFDIFQETCAHVTYYVEKEQFASIEQIEEIKNTWRTGLVKQIKEEKTLNGIKLSDIINAFPIESNESEIIFKQLCDAKRVKGKLSDKERNLMLIQNFTLKQINEAIGFNRKEHKPHIFSTETKAKLNTYHNRKLQQTDIEDLLTEQEKQQSYMDKIEQL